MVFVGIFLEGIVQGRLISPFNVTGLTVPF